MKITRALTVWMLVAITSVLVACGSTSDGTTTVVTVVEKDSSVVDSATNDDAAADSPSADSESVSDEGTGGAANDEVTVPNEVGKNHQAAQDDLQAHGLYILSEEDATGQGRLLVLDRNWKVVSQSPAPGTKVAEDATITLRSKKYTD
jgi:beta-lactam-binding protein with PASTA domain